MAVEGSLEGSGSAAPALAALSSASTSSRFFFSSDCTWRNQRDDATLPHRTSHAISLVALLLQLGLHLAEPKRWRSPVRSTVHAVSLVPQASSSARAAPAHCATQRDDAALSALQCMPSLWPRNSSGSSLLVRRAPFEPGCPRLKTPPLFSETPPFLAVPSLWSRKHTHRTCASLAAALKR